MPYTNDGKWYFEPWQLDELQSLASRLRQLNSAARQLLCLGHSTLPIEVYRRAGEGLEILGRQMKLLTECRKDIIASARAQRPPAVVFNFVCLGCRGKEPPGSDRKPELFEVPQVHPAHYGEILFLQELASRIYAQLFARFRTRRVFPVDFFAKLDRLNKALRRQRNHLEELASGQASRVQVRFSDKTCVVCQGEMKTLMGPHLIPHDPDKPMHPENWSRP